MFLKKIGFVAILLAFIIRGIAQTAYTNPVIPGDFADPSVIKVGDTYYAAGTSSEWAPHFPLFTSKDLVNWKQAGYIFNKKPEWTASSFWAPELFYYRNTFYVYYVAKRKSDGMSCIGVATSTNPLKGFTDHGIIVAHGREAIDPFVISDGGQLYITFKAYGLEKRPIEILGARLSADGLKMTGEPFTILRDDPRIGLEGQVLIKKNNYYYLLYSAGGCCGIKCSYNVRVARAATIQGPYAVYDGNPLLTENEVWKCPGHGTLVQTPANKYYYLYHAYSKKDNVFTGRQGMLDELVWDKTTGWPRFKNGNSPSVSNPVPVPGTRQILPGAIDDDFNTTQLPLYWQWDFRHCTPVVKLEKENLLLSGETDTGNHTGTALTVRPVSGNYTVTTELWGNNASLKGLVLYGDANQSVGIGIAGNEIQLWEVKNNDRKILNKALIQEGPEEMKMEVRNGYQCRFYYRQNEGWQELKIPGSEYYDGKHLPPWDRSPRPGLLHYGSKEAPAGFLFFNVTYN